MSEIGALTRRLREELAAQGEEPPAYAPIAPATVRGASQRYGLPSAYRELLAALGQEGFTISPGPFRAIVLYAAPDLEAAQVGFRGPRPGDESFVAPHGWHRSWVVIATDAGDPYFLDVTKADARGECPVYTAMHGTGTWEPLLAASSVEQYLCILDVWLRIVLPHHDRQNPDEPLDELHTRRLAAEIARIDPAAAPQWQQ
ncbi:MAG TPA: SMI1/KNR4 family protein [Thermomicrobiales bacterium]|nr:SMI1/KNR4 family protein [Thermomicrobiales bacterium]